MVPYQFLCPPSLKLASMHLFFCSPTFVSFNNVRKNASNIAPNLINLSKKKKKKLKFSRNLFKRSKEPNRYFEKKKPVTHGKVNRHDKKSQKLHQKNYEIFSYKL